MSELKLIIKPDPEEIEAAEVYVDGVIGGNAYRFLLDTGAGKSSIAFDDFTSTFASIDKHNASGVFAAGSNDLITIPSLEVGPIFKKNLTITRAAQNSPAIRNLIGMDILKDYCCDFRFDEQRVLLRAIDFQDQYAFQDLFLDQKFHPYIDVQFGTVTARAVWDTGASITIVDTNFIRKYPDFFEESGTSSGTDSTGSTVDTPMFVIGATTIGKHSFPPLRAVGVDLSHVNFTIEVPMDMILGYSALRKAHWLFDFPGKKWAITNFLD
jgi:hypothetical protein